jgi:membrane-associated protein
MPASAALVSLVPALGAQPALLPDWLDAEHLISSFGSYALVGVVLVVFVETGLLFPLLPGDSLLFTAGALVAQDALDFPLWLLCVLLFLAAFLGDQVAYLIGSKAGPRLFARPDSRVFKQTYVDQTYAYFDRYGGRTVILARFVPIVRTYAPVAAGVGGMRYRTFVSYNVIGAFVWGVGITVLGFALGTVSFVRENIEALAVLIVLISVVPVAIEVWRGRRAARRGDAGRDPRYDEPAERAEVEPKAFDA